jgi:hypothetical protein
LEAPPDHGTTIVAELAPDEDDVADRITQRVRLEMEETYPRRLQESQSRGTPVMAVKLEDDKSDQDDKEWFFYGFSKPCVLWTTIVLLLAGGVVGVLFGADIVGGDDGTNDGVVVAPTEPPLVLASPVFTDAVAAPPSTPAPVVAAPTPALMAAATALSVSK